MGKASPLISFAEASELMAGVSVSAIRQRKGGTESLTHVSGFGRRVFLIRAEVDALIERKIAEAQAAHRKTFRLVKGAV